ncbi:MAG: IS110 family transposase [Treponema sp.]|nr:IS110 family transposase [Treponema sp.]
MDSLEHLEDAFDKLIVEINKTDASFMSEIEILTSMTGISVITAIAVSADVSDVSRFRNSKHFAYYLRSAPRVESSNDKTIIKSTNKAARKLSITLIFSHLIIFVMTMKSCAGFTKK